MSGVKLQKLGPRRWNRMVNGICKRTLGVSLKQYRKLVALGAFDWDGDAHSELMKIEMLAPRRSDRA